jgi:MFS family permease
MAKKTTLKRKAKSLLYVSNIWSIAEGMFGPLFALYAERIGGSVLDISIAWAVYLIITGVLIIYVGKISDKHIRKETLMAIGYVLDTILTFSYLFVQTPTQLLVIQVGLGISTSLSIPTWDALYAKHTRKSKSGYAYGLVNGQGHLLTGIAIILGGLVVNYFSFSFLFILMGLIQTAGTILIITAFRTEILNWRTLSKEKAITGNGSHGLGLVGDVHVVNNN